MPEQFERRPKVKKISKGEPEPDHYQFKKILKKGPSNEVKTSTNDHKTEQMSVKGALSEEEKEKLIALMDDDGEVIEERTIFFF